MVWLEPWRAVTPQDPGLAAAYVRELQAELADGHPLYGVPVAAVGNNGSDDVLYKLLDGTERAAVVHLTWARHPEPPPWPVAEVYPDIETFAAERMRPDHTASNY